MKWKIFVIIIMSLASILVVALETFYFGKSEHEQNDLSGSSGEILFSQVSNGEQLYTQYCVSCHGVRGVGENPDDIYAIDDNGYVIAPPMDDTGHAWHHTDAQLIQTILEGSPRNPRMMAWKNTLTPKDSKDIIDYIKSLWSTHIRENCQGAKHMNPGCMK